MGSAVGIRDGICKRQNLIVVAVIVLQNNIDKNFIALSRDHDRFWMKHLLVFAELFYKLFDAMLVKKCLFFRWIGALIHERNFEAGVKKRQFAQPRREPLKLKLRRDREDRRIWQKRDEGSGGLFVFDFADDGQFVGRFAYGESHVIDLAIAGYFHFEPFRKCVRAFCADAM